MDFSSAFGQLLWIVVAVMALAQVALAIVCIGITWSDLRRLRRLRRHDDHNHRSDTDGGA